MNDWNVPNPMLRICSSQTWMQRAMLPSRHRDEEEGEEEEEEEEGGESEMYFFKKRSFFWQTCIPNDPLWFICDWSNTTQAACFSPWAHEQLLAHNYVVIHCYLEEKTRGDSEGFFFSSSSSCTVNHLTYILLQCHRVFFFPGGIRHRHFSSRLGRFSLYTCRPSGSDPGDPPPHPLPPKKEEKKGWLDMD